MVFIALREKRTLFEETDVHLWGIEIRYSAQEDTA